MNKTLKIFTTLVLAFALCLGLAAVPASAAENGAWAKTYLKKIKKLNKEFKADGTTGIKYNLIDIDGDDIPELVVDQPGFWLSLYTCDEKGKLIEIWDYAGYGAFGNAGYEYLPGQNIMRNFNNDFAGGIVYEYYMKMTDGDIVPYYDEGALIQSWIVLDPDTFEILEENYDKDPVCSFSETGRELTLKEYEEYVIDGDFDWICGKYNFKKIKKQLKNAQ